jgi:hypothetical protein
MLESFTEGFVKVLLVVVGLFVFLMFAAVTTTSEKPASAPVKINREYCRGHDGGPAYWDRDDCIRRPQ